MRKSNPGISESDKQDASALLTEYCRKSVPERVQDKVRMSFRWRGAAVTLMESRPYFQDKNRWLESPVAQFRYDAATLLWTLYCHDRNCRWFPYLDAEPCRSLKELLAEVDEDPTGIFWG